LGLDVHDVPSASKPDVNFSLENKKIEGHKKLYDYLRLRLVLEEGMVVVRNPFSPSIFIGFLSDCNIVDGGTWDILPPTPLDLYPGLSLYRSQGVKEVRVGRRRERSRGGRGKD
jgi:hypothetical protein